MKENPNVSRLAEDPEPDLKRDINGYVITLHYTPSLRAPKKAIVEVHAGAIRLDSLEVEVEDGYDVYLHTTGRSTALAEALR